MPTAMPFGEVLEAANRLSLEEQEEVVEILHHRIVELRREELAHDIHQAEAEHRAGQAEPRTAADLMREILG